MCWCSIFLNYVRSFNSDVPYSLYESRRGPDGSKWKYITVGSIRKCVGVLLVRLILQA